MNQKKKAASRPAASHRTGAEAPAQQAPETQQSTKTTRQKIATRSIILFWFILIALLVIFGGRWLMAIMNGYYTSFVERGSSVSEAVSNMEGLNLSDAEAETLLPLEQQWDLFTSSRLRDEVRVTAEDGVSLHGYLYDAGSDVTVVVLPRFNLDGTADFLPGSWLFQQTGCNILMPDPRAHGESGGDVFGYGYLEQHDLASWLGWAEQELGAQQFILWGEGVGANTILFAEAGGFLPDSVLFAVVESPYASLHELAARQIWKWYTVPSFPFLNAVEWKLSRSDAGYTIADTDLGSALQNSSCDLPVLFLESTVDEYILPEWSNGVYTAYSGEKELISGGLSHGTVYAYTAQETQDLLVSWCNDRLAS